MKKKSKKSKIQNNVGSVFQREDGRWSGKFSVGKDENDKYITKTFYGKSEEEVLNKLNDFKLKYKLNKDYVKVENKLLSDLMLDWLLIFKKSTVTSRTFENNIQNFYKHIKPYIKDVKMCDVNTVVLQKVINVMINQNYANQTIKKVKFLFNQFFDYAIESNWLSINPASKIKVKLHDKRNYTNKEKYKAISPENRNLLLEKLDNDENKLLKPLCVVLMFAGLRIGEALALQWKNVNFTNKTITIEYAISKNITFDEKGNTKDHKTIVSDTKTVCSVREIPALDIVIDTLNEWKEYQKKRSIKINKNLVDSTIPVFANDDGTIRTYSGTRCILNRFIERNHLEKLGLHFHGLRHTFSNMLFEMNENPKAIQQLLGHKDVKTTITVYNSVNSDYVKITTEKLNEKVTKDINESKKQKENTNDLNSLSDEEFNNYIVSLIASRKK